MTVADYSADVAVWPRQVRSPTRAPNFHALASLHWRGLDLVDEGREEIQAARTIAGATGGELDDFGDFAGIDRRGIVDLLFRAGIIARARVLFTWGGRADLLTITRTMLDTVGPPDRATQFLELFPKSYLLLVEDLTDDEQLMWHGALRGFPASGEWGAFLAVNENEQFHWGSVHGATTVLGHWGSVHGAVAGSAGFAHLGYLPP